MPCPNCRSLCERESGCNFMTCPSEECQSKVHFCYLCGELLAASDHASHYEGFEGAVGRMGPFGSVCLNKRVADMSLPHRPSQPSLSVVAGEDEGSMALRLTFGEHESEPPTIYYRVQLIVAGTSEQITFQAGVHDAYYDMKPSRQIQKFRKYQVVLTPVNINGVGPASDPSEIVHFHPREMVPDSTSTEDVVQKVKRWSAR